MNIHPETQTLRRMRSRVYATMFTTIPQEGVTVQPY